MSDYERRVEQAKRISAALLTLLNSPKGLLVPVEMRLVFADFSSLIVELARCSHAKFDMSPHDFSELVREVESLRLFKATLIKRGVVAALDFEGKTDD
jgi:hypothetical protein